MQQSHAMNEACLEEELPHATRQAISEAAHMATTDAGESFDNVTAPFSAILGRDAPSKE